MNEGRRKIEAPAHASGVGTNRTIACIGKAEALQELYTALPYYTLPQMRQPAYKPQVLHSGQVGVDCRVLTCEPDQRAHLTGLLDHIQPQDLGSPSIRVEYGGQYPDHGGLASPVGPEQAEYGPGGDLEIDAVQSNHVPESLSHSFDSHRVRHVWKCSKDSSSCQMIGVSERRSPPLSVNLKYHSAMDATNRPVAAEVWRLLLKVAMNQFGRVAGIAQDLGLTPGHVKALLALDPGRPQTMGSLAQSFACDASTMTWLVDRLEERGLVERGGLKGDRRVKTVALTPRGVRTKSELEGRLYEPPAVMVDLGREELVAVRDVLKDLSSEIDNQDQVT